MTTSAATCARCKGKGIIVDRDYWLKGRTGWARYNERLCPECKGSGRVMEGPPRRMPEPDDSPF